MPDVDLVEREARTAAAIDAAKKEDAAARKPKYIDALFSASEQRKKDQLRARDKLLAREREAEGDEFADKDKFVTGAYKAQQEEAARAEEEERLRQEAEEAQKKKHGMQGFHKQMLLEQEQRHAEAMTGLVQAVLVAAVDQAVRVLHRHHARQAGLLGHAHELVHAIRRLVGQADVAHLAGAHEPVERLERRLERDVGIRHVDLVEVDLVDAEAPRRIDTSGVELDWAERLVADVRDGTDTFIGHDHAFAACRIVLDAQRVAEATR